jgi:hypothetical protein
LDVCRAFDLSVEPFALSTLEEISDDGFGSIRQRNREVFAGVFRLTRHCRVGGVSRLPEFFDGDLAGHFPGVSNLWRRFGGDVLHAFSARATQLVFVIDPGGYFRPVDDEYDMVG